MVDSTLITPDTDEELWSRLREQWQGEREPGWVITKTMTYQVVQTTDGQVAFKPHTSENLYESTSFV